RARDPHRDHLDLHLREGLSAVRDQLHGRGRAAHHRPPVGGGLRGAQARRALAMIRTRRQRHVRQVVRLAAAVAITSVFLFPIYWLFMMSFKTAEEIYSYPPKWYPGGLGLGNYMVLFKDGDAATVWHSLVIAGVSTLLSMFLGT